MKLSRTHLVVSAALVVLGAVIGLAAWSMNRPDAGPQYQGTALAGPAPDFRLTDHHGQPVSLSDFRGRVAVLSFMDSRCGDICPLTAIELRKAYEALNRRRDVVFLGINVNANFNRIQDVDEFTKRYQLGEIPWHFLSGRPEELAPIWAAYHVDVQPQREQANFAHTPGIYIVDQKGNLRWYISTPLSEENLLARWDGPRESDLIVDKVRALLS